MRYTVILYSLPDGGAQTFKVDGAGADEATSRAVEKSGLSVSSVEVIVVIRGDAQFEPVDEKKFLLFPYFSCDETD